MRHLLGRRSILMLGAFACGICQLLPAVTASAGVSASMQASILTAFIALFKFSYNGGVGVASFPVATEVVSTRLRAWTVGSANAIGYLLAWLISFCSPYFINPAELGLVSSLICHRNSVTTVDTRSTGRSLRIHLGGQQLCLRDLVLLLHAGDVEPHARGAGRNVLEQGISPQLPQISVPDPRRCYSSSGHWGRRESFCHRP
jgi:hypothetical protein